MHVLSVCWLFGFGIHCAGRVPLDQRRGECGNVLFSTVFIIVILRKLFFEALTRRLSEKELCGWKYVV